MNYEEFKSYIEKKIESIKELDNTDLENWLYSLIESIEKEFS